LKHKIVTIFFVLALILLTFLSFFAVIEIKYFLLLGCLWFLIVFWGSSYIASNYHVKTFCGNSLETDKKIALTFDDGPNEFTLLVLDVLKKYNVKAAFFCIGKNINNHADIFLKVINEGHSIGNHTYNHLKGWNTSTEDYLDNIALCNTEILNVSPVLKSKIFRPPYGKIVKSQSKKLRQLGYKIIMWDVLSADFDQTITPEKCLENVLQNVQSGSIIVFHDSVKAFKNLEYALPRTLEILKQRGFIFEAIQ